MNDPHRPMSGAPPLPDGTADLRAVEALRERVKELTCLYRVAAVFAERVSLREALERVASTLPRALRFPEHAAARVHLDEARIRWPQDHRGEPIASIAAPIVISGTERGRIALEYAHAAAGAGVGAGCGPAGSNGWFLDEERALLDTVAHQIGMFVASVEAEQRHAEMERSLRHADRLATIGQLAAGVAHELNEPLGNVLGFAQLALRADVPAQVRSDLERIAQASLHGREIIRKLLVFARQAPVSKQCVSINAIVDEAMFLLEAGCEKPGVRFERHLADNLPEIEADPVQVRQVLTNLVVNAMQAIETEGTIRVRTTSTDTCVEVVVEDTGVGMSPETLRHAFDPFFTTKDVGHGTGLGLAVVQGIVAGHGGRIDVESTPDVGSTFTLRLPIGARTLE